MVRAIPHALRNYDATIGTMLRVDVEDAPWAFDVARGEGGWFLSEECEGRPTAVVSLSGDTAWRMLTHNLPENKLDARLFGMGNQQLIDAVARAFALVA
jgi:hypothetical protein